jgi:hypothetical protein
MKSLRPSSSRAATLMLLMDHELSEASRAALVQRLGSDDGDRRRLQQHERLRGLLSSTSLCSGEIDLVEAVHGSLHHREQAARLSVRHLWASGLASAAGLVLILGLGRWQSEEPDARTSREREPEFRAKSTTEGQTERWAGVHIYRVDSDGEPTRIAGEIEAGTPLLFSYANLAVPPFDHLLIFAVDSLGDVFWFHPAHPGGGSDPVSIPVMQATQHVPIAEVIRQPLAVGDVEFHAVFTREPLHVSEVEAWLSSHPGQRYALPASDGMVQVISARVVP